MGVFVDFAVVEMGLGVGRREVVSEAIASEFASL